MGQALGAFAGHEVEVGGGAADDRAKADDAVVLARGGQFLGGQGNLEGPGDAHDGQVGAVAAVAHEVVHGPADQAFGDEVVEAAGHQGEFESLGVKLAFDGAHVQHGCSP